MAKFRKKPVVIEARRWSGHKVDAPYLIGWIGEPCLGAVSIPGSDLFTLQIKTLEGEHTASPGDWIIQGVKGEFYPCKPDIFEATYELVETVIHAGQSS